MKHFILKLGGFLALQLALFALLWDPGMSHDRNYLAASIDKHRRLRKTPSPRIILLGGSNLAFGIKGKTLEEELGLPVVNMGLNVHLGVPFILDDVASTIRPGDVLVLSLEHASLSFSGDDRVLAEMLELRPSTLFNLPFSRSRVLIDRHGLSILGGIVRRTILPRFETFSGSPTETTSARNFFDEHGSFTAHYGRPTTLRLKSEHVPEISSQIHDKIESFVRLCQARNALCFYSCPPQPIPLMTPVPPQITENLARLQKINGLIVLDTPVDHVYPPEHFFDSNYHLLEQGAEQRTKKLASKLRPFLKSNLSLNKSNPIQNTGL